MHERGSGNHGIALRLAVGNMERCAPAGDGDIDRKDATGKIGEDTLFEPCAQDHGLGWIAALDQQYAAFDLQDGDGRQEELGQLDVARPGPHMRIGVVRATQLRDDIGVEQVHQSRSAGREMSPSFAGSNSKSPPSQPEMASSKVRPLPVSR